MVTFRDENLHLALLDEIQPQYAWIADVEEDYSRMRADHPDWPSWEEIEADEDEPKPALRTFLLTMDVPADALAKITSLTLDGDRELYGWVYPDWWHFGDHFTIRDLTGLERCTSLTYLNLGQGVTEACSLRPLAALSELTELWVCALCKHTDIEALLELPKLTKLQLANWKASDDAAAWQRVVDAVAARAGVQ